MTNLSLGTIEVYGLPAAVEAADVALKTADVKLIGYETTDGMGMVAVKVEGQVSAVKSAVAAARAAAAKVSKVFATSVIPRPSDQLEPVVLTSATVGLAAPVAEPESPAVAPAVADPAVPEDSPSAADVPSVPEVAVPTPPAATPPPAAQPVTAPAEPPDAPAAPAAEPAKAAPRPRASRTRRPTTPPSPNK